MPRKTNKFSKSSKMRRGVYPYNKKNNLNRRTLETSTQAEECPQEVLESSTEFQEAQDLGTIETISIIYEDESKEDTTEMEIGDEDISNEFFESEHGTMEIEIGNDLEYSNKFNESGHEISESEIGDDNENSNILDGSEGNVTENSDYDFEWGNLEYYNEIAATPLEIEKDHTYEPAGYRIVEAGYFMQRILLLQKQHFQRCPQGMLIFDKEDHDGLSSTFTFYCTTCLKHFVVNSESEDNRGQINKAAVYATLSTGSTFSQTQEFLSILDVPSISSHKYYAIQNQIADIAQICSWESMEEAAKEEYRIAEQKGDINEDGTASITVCADGSWPKRSYGHSFKSLSGFAVIIGKATGKALFAGVRNKYCTICTKAANKNVEPNTHECFKNWTGSSCSMEADIIVEGFKTSISLHKLKYTRLIADGDSSVFSRLQKEISYGREIKKIECVNHIIKNYGKQLHKIRTNRDSVSLEARKLLTVQKVKDLQNLATKIMKHHQNGNVDELKNDLRLSAGHCFNNHENCRPAFCSNSGASSSSNSFEDSGLNIHVYAALQTLLIKADSLILCQTNNAAEFFMSMLGRYISGKRCNFTGSNNYKMRTELCTVKYNEKANHHTKTWKKMTNKNPGKYFQKFIDTQQQLHLKKQNYVPPRHKKSDDDSKQKQKDYGPNIAEATISNEELKEEVEKLIKHLQLTKQDIKKIERSTIGQFKNPLYKTHRMHRLTASNFGAVIKRRESTKPDALIKRILNNKEICTASIQYGKTNETVAIQQFSRSHNVHVEPCGLFIDEDHHYLGASPDGLILGENKIVEVKCLYKVVKLGISLLEAVKAKKVDCLCIENNAIHLKKTHDYYYQIQGQLAISKRETALLIIYVGEDQDIFTEEIKFDQKLWIDVMVPKLKHFYITHLAPEIILNQRRNNYALRSTS